MDVTFKEFMYAVFVILLLVLAWNDASAGVLDFKVEDVRIEPNDYGC